MNVSSIILIFCQLLQTTYANDVDVEENVKKKTSVFRLILIDYDLLFKAILKYYLLMALARSLYLKYFDFDFCFEII